MLWLRYLLQARARPYITGRYWVAALRVEFGRSGRSVSLAIWPQTNCKQLTTGLRLMIRLMGVPSSINAFDKIAKFSLQGVVNIDRSAHPSCQSHVGSCRDAILLLFSLRRTLSLSSSKASEPTLPSSRNSSSAS